MELTTVKFENEFGLKDVFTYKGGRIVKTEFNYPKQTNINNKTNKMLESKSDELFNQISTLYEQFREGHEGKTKKAKKDARKALGEIKKLVTEYRKVSVEENK